jgi:hypothetical protein
MTALQAGLRPFVARELESAYGKYWVTKATEGWRNDIGWNEDEPNLDAHALLKLMWDNWNDAFRNILGQAERSIVSELRDWRNAWAHQKAFSTDDTYRALDSAERLLRAISAPEVEEVEKLKQELLRIRFEEQARKETRKASTATLEGQPAGGLKPWREVVTPHPDVASGRYQQAEFAADLGQVYRGEGSDEYRDPTEFFRRTYLTEGLKMLLTGALKRLSGVGGDPVVELQTNFGGGKTHSQLALFHLFGGRAAADLPGIEAVLQEAGVAQPPTARRSVLVGTAISPAHTHRMADGTMARTLWGVMAWQLLGKEGYGLVREADEAGISPGSETLQELFRRASPCLILIDEWIAFVRQVYGINGLPAGSFDANLTFAQALTEAAKMAPQTLVVASIPASDIEVGGDGGREALARLKNTFARIESAWRPASAEEGFEIVRRRLFQNITDPSLFKARDAVVRAFGEMYRDNPNDFPTESREADYEKRMQAAYPIHPELFDRLYRDWSSLEKFQRTRGVLRLMAAVIYELWEREDRSLTILPASVPVSANPVQFELTRYMEDPWVPVIEKDVDGPSALPLQLDRDNPNLGRFSACRRVARTLYLGSAPTLHTGSKGLEDRQIRLGCVQPGESVAVFGDALRRLTDNATHLYVDGRRYWYSTQPSVTRMAQERAQQRSDDEVHEEIKRRLREEMKDARNRGEFAAVHVAPASASDVPDDRDARLVVLGPEYPHSRGIRDGKARQEAGSLLEQRGSAPRLHRNALVFLAPDQTRLEELNQAVRQFIAWKSIHDEWENLGLDAFQRNQAKTKKDQSEEAIRQRIPEAYQWLLYPEQPDPRGPIEWAEVRVQGADGLAARVSKRLKTDGLLVTAFAGTELRRELDKVLWRDTDHVSVRQLLDWFAQYPYLSRLKSGQTLLDAITDGVKLVTWEQDTFAYADSYDEQAKRYVGLRAGQVVPISSDGRGLLVKSEAAVRQMEAEKPAPQPSSPVPESKYPMSTGTANSSDGAVAEGPELTLMPPPVTPKTRKARRFHGSVKLDATRLSRETGRVNDEVIQHLVALLRSQAEITLEISVEVPEGIPDTVIRTVSENCRTLKFTSHEFEEE